jgi:hypothetical protein
MISNVASITALVAGAVGQRPAPVWRVRVGRTALTCSLGDGGCRCTVLASFTQGAGRGVVHVFEAPASHASHSDPSGPVYPSLHVQLFCAMLPAPEKA